MRKGTGGWIACLLLGLGAAAVAAPAPQTPAAIYQQAQARFNANDLAGASGLLEHVPTAGITDRERADIANLRGAIALRQHHYDEAREEFAAAAAKDPHLWAARYNEAEVNFRRGKYDEASRQFGELSGQSKGLLQGRERRFAEYKRLLADLLAGREQPAQTFIAGHRDEKNPPLAYYYLNAALEERRGRSQNGAPWLAQADGKYPSAAQAVFAESFQNLGWSTAHSERLVAVVNDDGKPAAVRKPASDGTRAAAPATARQETPARPTEASTPAPAKPAFRTTSDAPAQPAFRAANPVTQDVNGQMPPVVDAREPQTLVEDAADARGGSVGPAVLGKPSSSRHSTPTPSPQPSSSPAADSAASPSPSASPDAAAATSAASSPPGATPAPAFVQKYEAAYVKYLEKDYQGAKTLLDEADAIQSGQKSSADLRDLIFKAYYEAGYVSFRKGDYLTALEQLSNADAVRPNNPDSLNLRGLVLSRQRNYEQAETAFKKASTIDPSFYAAKFNYAELPFNYRNYTVARARFEELFAQTDPVKQPVEAEITQFKVFLTLLLEGKADAARTFMDHFTFTGATPARYFCQAALDFYRGDMEKAQGWIDSAGKEFKPQLVSIFKESFYRIGWMTDVNGQSSFAGAPGNAAPGASSSPALVTLNAATPRASVPPYAALTSTPAASATPTPAASVAAASVAPTPIKPPATASPTPAIAAATATPVAAARTPAVAAATATPSPAAHTPAVAAATATPTPAAHTPAIAAATATPTPAAHTPALAAATATPTPAARTPAVAAATATPVPTAAGAASALATATPTPEEQSTPPDNTTSDDSSQVELFVQIFLGCFIVSLFVGNIFLYKKVEARRQARMLARGKSPTYSGDRKELEPEEAQTPR